MQLNYMIAYVKEPNNTFSIYIPDVLQKPIYNNPPNNITSVCELVFFGGISRFLSEYSAYPKPFMHSKDLLFNYVKRHREKAGLTTDYMFVKEMSMLVDSGSIILPNKHLKDGYVDMRKKVYHPSKILYVKFMKSLNISIPEIIKMAGLTNAYDIEYFNHFMRAESPVTPDLASRLSIVLNTSSELWLALQKEYDDYMLETYTSEAVNSTNIQPVYYQTFKDKQD